MIVAGKGGVGKTTVTATLAAAAADAGLSVLIVEVEGKSGLAACFGEAPLTYEEAELRPRVRARTLTPDDATTVIHGPIVDQAALHGVLQKVRDLGLPLVSVIRVEPHQPDEPASSPDSHNQGAQL